MFLSSSLLQFSLLISSSSLPPHYWYCQGNYLPCFVIEIIVIIIVSIVNVTSWLLFHSGYRHYHWYCCYGYSHYCHCHYLCRYSYYCHHFCCYFLLLSCTVIAITDKQHVTDPRPSYGFSNRVRIVGILYLMLSFLTSSKTVIVTVTKPKQQE